MAQWRILEWTLMRCYKKFPIICSEWKCFYSRLSDAGLPEMYNSGECEDFLTLLLIRMMLNPVGLFFLYICSGRRYLSSRKISQFVLTYWGCECGPAYDYNRLSSIFRRIIKRPSADGEYYVTVNCGLVGDPQYLLFTLLLFLRFWGVPRCVCCTSCMIFYSHFLMPVVQFLKCLWP